MDEDCRGCKDIEDTAFNQDDQSTSALAQPGTWKKVQQIFRSACEWDRFDQDENVRCKGVTYLLFDLMSESYGNDKWTLQSVYDEPFL